MIEKSHLVHRLARTGERRRLALVVWPVVGCLGFLGCWTFIASDPPHSTTKSQTGQSTQIGSRDALPASPASIDGRDAASSRDLNSARTGEITAGSLGTGQEPDDSDAGRQRQVLGDWEDEYQGKRFLTLRDDGTGTMVVVLSGIGKKLFAERMEFSLEWQLADGKITMTTTGGEPKSKVKLVLKLYGDQASYKIVNLDPGQMLLQDADGKTQYDWHRPGDPERTATLE